MFFGIFEIFESGIFAGIAGQCSLEYLKYLKVGDLRELSGNVLWNTVKFARQGSPEIGKWEVRDYLSLVAHH